jgi:hypothetical protein
VTEPTPEPELTREQKADLIRNRKRIIIKARNRAYSILAREYPERFQQIKDDLLVRWGHDPIDKSHQRRLPTGDPMSPPSTDSDRSQ